MSIRECVLPRAGVALGMVVFGLGAAALTYGFVGLRLKQISQKAAGAFLGLGSSVAAIGLGVAIGSDVADENGLSAKIKAAWQKK